MSDGRIVYRLADGSGHVALDAGEWAAFGELFQEQVRPVAHRTSRLMLGLFPAIFVLALTIGQILPFAGLLIVAGVFLGPPAIYLWQSHRIKGIARAIEQELARRPRTAAPPPLAWRAPRWLQIAALLLVGPGLIIQVYGSLFPDAFRNTPWSRMHLGWGGVAGFVVLAAMLYCRWRAAQEPLPKAPEDMPSRGRRLGVIARARES